MGLDMYAYVAVAPGQQREYYDGAVFDKDTNEYTNKTVTKPREIAYWRKHPNLHGWMEQLWEDKGRPGLGIVDPEDPPSFNGIELELTREDLDQLEQDILENNLPSTTGFFFGDNADRYYREQDLKFVIDARADLFMGLKVFYNSSW